MNKIFEGVSVAGIVIPGNIYLFCDHHDRAGTPEPIEYLYIIKDEVEILRALDMELCIVMAESFDPIKFGGIHKISDDCHAFSMLCYEKDTTEEVKYTLYLHRIQSFEQALRQVENIFDHKMQTTT